MITGIKAKRPRDRRAIETFSRFSLLRNIGKGVDRHLSWYAAGSPERFAVVIGNKLRHVAPVRARRSSFFGRLFNKLAYQDPTYIELTGVELSTLLKLTEESTDLPVVESIDVLYLVPTEEIERLHGQLKSRVAKEGESAQRP